MHDFEPTASDCAANARVWDRFAAYYGQLARDTGLTKIYRPMADHAKDRADNWRTAEQLILRVPSVAPAVARGSAGREV